MNTAPSQAPTTGYELEKYKSELLREFANKEFHSGEEEPTELILTEATDAENPSAQAMRIQALVMSSIATAAKSGLIISGGHPVLLKDQELRAQLELHPFFNARGRLDGDDVQPHISVRRASMRDIEIIDDERKHVDLTREKTLRDIRNALVPAIKRNSEAASEAFGLYM